MQANKTMTKKKHKKQTLLSKSKKSTAAGRRGRGSPSAGQVRSGGRRSRHRPLPAVDDDLQQHQQHVQQLRRSLGLTSAATRRRPDTGGSAENGASEVEEGLEHLLKTAKQGHISMMQGLDKDETIANKKNKARSESATASKRRRSDSEDSDSDAEMEYERTPRAFPAVRDLLPIKTKAGVVKRKMLVRTEETADATAEADTPAPEDASSTIAPPPLPAASSVVDIYAQRRASIDGAKLRIGLLSRALLETPLQKHGNLRHLLALLADAEPSAGVTVRKYAAASLLEVFKDLLPAYQLEQHDLTQQLKKETLAQYQYENALVAGYRLFLVRLEECAKGLSSDQPPVKGLALFCLELLCQCLVRFRDFNFASNLVSALVPFTGHADAAARAAVAAAVRAVFAEDRSAERSLEIVRRLHQLIKAKQWDCRRDITDLFLSLRIRHVDLDRQRNAEVKTKRFMTYKEKLKHMSRNERKRSKKLEALERELLATRAEESRDDQQRHHSHILTVVFTVYFKILKQMPRSGLMASVLEGLAKFAHMINVDFFHDLVASFEQLLSGGCLADTRQVLLCVQTVFTMLSGQGEAINIDPQRFYGHCYRALGRLSLADDSDELRIALVTLETMLVRRRKKVSPQRVLSFAKRLAALALRAPHPAALAALSLLRSVTLAHPGVSRLLDTESVAGGLYLPEVNDPEYCGAANTLLYELTALRRSYHQPVRSLAAHLMLSCPGQGDAALTPALRQMAPADVLETYGTSEMRFVPAVTPPSVLKKRQRKSMRRAAAAADPVWVTEQLAAAEGDPDGSTVTVGFAALLRPPAG